MANAQVLSPQLEKLCEKLRKRSESDEPVPILDVSELMRPEGKSKDQFRTYSMDFVSISIKLTNFDQLTNPIISISID